MRKEGKGKRGGDGRGEREEKGEECEDGERREEKGIWKGRKWEGRREKRVDSENEAVSHININTLPC